VVRGETGERLNGDVRREEEKWVKEISLWLRWMAED